MGTAAAFMSQNHRKCTEACESAIVFVMMRWHEACEGQFGDLATDLWVCVHCILCMTASYYGEGTGLAWGGTLCWASLCYAFLCLRGRGQWAVLVFCT